MTTAGSYIVQVKLEVDKQSEKKFALDRLTMAKEMIGKEYAYREKLFLTMNSRMIKSYSKNYQSFLNTTRDTPLRTPSSTTSNKKELPLYLPDGTVRMVKAPPNKKTKPLHLPDGTKIAKTLGAIERRMMSAEEVNRIKNDNSHLKNPESQNTVVDDEQPEEEKQSKGRKKKKKRNTTVLGGLGKASMLIYLIRTILNFAKAGLFADPTDAKNIISQAFSRVSVSDIGASIGLSPTQAIDFDSVFGEQIGLGQGTVIKTLQNMYLKGFSNPTSTLQRIAKQVQGRSFRFTSAIADAYGVDPQTLLTISQAGTRTDLNKNYKSALNSATWTEKDINHLFQAEQGKQLATLMRDNETSKLLDDRVKTQMVKLYSDEYINALKDVKNLERLTESNAHLKNIEGVIKDIHLTIVGWSNGIISHINPTAIKDSVVRGATFLGDSFLYQYSPDYYANMFGFSTKTTPTLKPKPKGK